MARPLVWIAGDVDEPSLVPAADWLREVAEALVVSPDESCAPLAPRAEPGRRLVPRVECPLAEREDHIARAEPAGRFSAPVGFPLAEREDHVAAIVLFQARPGRLSQRHVEQIHRQAPLARLVVVLGPWCEGEPRSSRPWQGVTRIYWHEWQARLLQELRLAIGVGRGRGQRLRTLTEADLLLRALTPALHRQSPAGLIAISTVSRESFASLADACQIAGYQALWQQPELPPQYSAAVLLLIDGWESCPPEIGPKSVLLLDWPRPDDIDRAAAQGISRVLAKPLLLANLLATFDALLGPAKQTWSSQSAA